MVASRGLLSGRRPRPKTLPAVREGRGPLASPPRHPPAPSMGGWQTHGLPPAIGNRDRRHAGHRGGFRSIGTSSLSAAPSSGSPGSSKVGVEGPRPRCGGPGRSCRSRGGLGRRTRRRRDRKPPDVPCACADQLVGPLGRSENARAKPRSPAPLGAGRQMLRSARKPGEA